MADKPLVVADDLVVSLDYILRLDEQGVVDSSADSEPLEFLQGYGQIIPGLESELYGLAIGEGKEIVITPADGYGERSADAFQEIPREAFPPEIVPEPGMVLQMVDEDDEPTLAIVVEVGADDVLLDFNHPLAGETLHFSVTVADLRPATAEELDHGHVHGAEHDHWDDD